MAPQRHRAKRRATRTKRHRSKVSRKRGRTQKRSRSRTGTGTYRSMSTSEGGNKSRLRNGRTISSRFRSRSHNMMTSCSKLDLSKMKEPDIMKGIKFNTYLRKLAKRVSPRTAVSLDTMRVLDCWMKGIIHQIGTVASSRMGKRKVLKPKLINKAMKRIIPCTIRLEAHRRGKMAVERFSRATGKSKLM